MEWQELPGGYSMATAGEGESSDTAMREFCKRIREYVIPQNEDVNWDVIRVEIWADSGRMIAFPSSGSRPERVEKAGCQVVFHELLAAYEASADSEMDDEAFAASLSDLLSRWIEGFVAAATASDLREAPLQFWDGSGPSPLRTVAGT